MTTPLPMQSTTIRLMAQGAPRGFVYPLEAIAIRKRWTLERLEREWNDSRRAAEAARMALRRIEDELGRASTASTPCAHGHHGIVKVDRQRRLLGYLMQLQQRRVVARKTVAERQEDETRARRRWTALQREIDTLDQDRARSITDYCAGLARIEAHEADRAWTVREAFTGVKADAAGKGELA